MDSAKTLVKLAQNNSREARVELASKTANQLLNSSTSLSESELQLFDDVFKHLYQFAPSEIKQQLSSTLALAEWAPQNILSSLANDDFEVAGPIISFSPVIDNDTLVKVINSKGEKHQACIAGRSNIDAEITSALIATNTADVVSALSNNRTATISEADFAHAVEIVKNNPSAIDNFAARTDLPAQLVAKVFDLASPKAKELLHKRRTKTAPPTIPPTKPKLVVAENTNNPSDQGLSANQFLALLANNQKATFIRHAAIQIGIDPDRLMNLISTDLVQNYGFIARALGLDRTAVAIMAGVFGSATHVMMPEDEKTIALLWMKYVAAGAKIHLQTITANM